jgi:hypothetical protein
MNEGISPAMILPIRDSVGAALRFVRENIRLVVLAAAMAALVQGVIALLGISLVWIVAVVAGTLLAYAAYLSTALGAQTPVVQGLAGNAGRVAGSMAMVGFFLALVFFVVTFFAMTAVIAPYQAQVQAAGEDEAAVRAIMETAMAENGDVMRMSMLFGAILVFALTTRFYVVAPATVDRRRITVFESWRMTRGNFLRIAGARLLLLAPAFILAWALQTLIARLLGAPSGDPIQVLQYSQSNAVGFAVFYTVSLFVQLAVVSALDAGLSASIYRRLNATSPPPPAA